MENILGLRPINMPSRYLVNLWQLKLKDSK